MFATQQKIIAELREVLASLYEHEASARRIAEDAGLTMASIAFSSIAIDTWRSILNEAKKQERLIFLIDLVATGEYKDNPLLKSVCDAYYALHESKSVLPRKKIKPSTIELKIEQNLDSYSQEDQLKLISVIEVLLRLDRDIKITKIRSGSVWVTIELPNTHVERLLTLIRAGRLNEVGVVGFNLRRADLSDANLSGANLFGADLFGADLRRADLSGADLRRANLLGADLSGADLRRANLLGAKLSNVKLGVATLSGADLSGAKLGVVDLRRANLSRANLSGADLSRATLSGADLSGADLSGADLSRANLSGADLRSANLRGAGLSLVQHDEHTKWPDDLDLFRSILRIPEK